MSTAPVAVPVPSTILIVDDRVGNRELMIAMLEETGHRLLTAASGDQALAIARRERPDLVITDVLMAGTNGFELTRRLRDEPGGDRTRILFWTAHYDDREVHEIADSLGVAGVLRKPCELTRLVETVDAALAGTAHHRPSGDVGHEHLRLLNDKLVEKTDELERTHAALRDSEEHFRLLVSNIPGAVYRRTFPDLRLEFVTDEIEPLTGYSAEFLLSSEGVHYAGLIRPDDRRAAIAGVRAATAAGTPYGLAYRVVRADGEERWVGDRGRAVADSHGVVRLYGTLSDITQRKRLEAERDRMEVELRMAQKLEAVGQLAAGIAHEINTPVQFVGDSVQFLKDAFDDLDALLAGYRDACAELVTGPDGEALRARLAEAERRADLEYLRERVPAAFERTLDGVDRVASIVRAMKEFAHPQSEQAPADLDRALQTTLTVARNEYKYVADVHTQLGQLPPVVCNLSDLNQVFLNLIVNAAHAIEERHGPHGERGTIRISTMRDGDTVVIAIADDGCGIPPDIRTRVFDPFFTTKPVGRGSGQGLALARAIVDRHRGTLELESQVAAGTTFTIRLPVGGAPA